VRIGRAIVLSTWYWVVGLVLLLRVYRIVQFKLNDIDRQNQTVFGDRDPLN
jgi:hypothetical protein